MTQFSEDLKNILVNNIIKFNLNITVLNFYKSYNLIFFAVDKIVLQINEIIIEFI